ncbi:MAG: hypothetical protein U5N55_02900 [Cypionkella sp.]|nr:hypothetical protein [Cypionkella sp.]
MKQDDFQRPKLTLPEDEARALSHAYGQASVILEYGSGGSTVLGAEMAGKTIFSVESDAEWLANMRHYFAAHPPLATLHLHHGDIGPTRGWGHPLDDDDFRSWPDYPTKIWSAKGFVHPDLVLIDGRFRVACFLTTLFSITKPLRVLFDDYLDRPAYAAIEEVVRPTAYVGRMAQFDLTPTPIPPAKLGWIVGQFLQSI